MNLKLNILYPRRYLTNGSEQIHWMTVGVAWMTDKGIDAKLWVTPPADSEGNIRLVFREPSPEEQQRRQQRPPQPQPQARQPQHRDQLARGPQQRELSPDPGPQPPAYTDPDDSIPF